MKDVVIVEGFRTPYAKAATALKRISPVDLGATIVKEVVARTGIDPLKIDEVIVGNAGMPAEAANIGRVIALRAGLPQHIPAYSVQRNCASGMQAEASAYTQILAGMIDIVLVAGVESMSGYNFYTTERLKEAFTAFQRGKTLPQRAMALLSLRPKDFIPVVGLTLGLTDPVSGLIMGETAEVLVREFGITRREQMVTMSVQLVGVYLVFTTLIVPALATYRHAAERQLVLGYGLAIVSYFVGLAASVLTDLPSSAVIVWRWRCSRCCCT